MKECTKCNEVKEFALFSICRGKNDGHSPHCKACVKIYKALNYQKNKALIGQKNKQWCVDNKERSNNIKAKWVQNNPEKRKAAGAKWATANRDKTCASSAKRRAVKLNATPSWANPESIKSWYSLAKMFDKTFGELHHVDHIVPLQGKHICGLHCENNLQILTATENLSKGNRYGY